ncbi:MAG: flagellar motor switch protein FliG [Treponemataceae bacterium]|nr:flagellar motor switch protein FliG [Treponemataceae bacterium]
MNENDYRLKAYANAKKSADTPQDSQGEVFFTPFNLAKNNFNQNPSQGASQNPSRKNPPRENEKKSFEKSRAEKNPVAGARSFFEENAQDSFIKIPSQEGMDEKLDSAVTAIKNGGLLKVGRDASDEKDSVHRRVAKFLLLIGTDEAAEVLKFLPQDDIEKIIPQLATIRSVSSDEAEEILAEFHSLTEKKVEAVGEDAALDILEKAFGAGKAQELFERVEKKIEVEHPFTCLKEKSPEDVLSILKGESTQVVSIVLSHLEPKKAAAIINLMDSEQKKEIVLRLAKMQKISPEVISAIDNTIRKKVSARPADDSLAIDGKGALVQILKRMDLGAEKEILDDLERFDPALKADLQKSLFTADDVANCDDRFLQERLRGMSDKQIAFLIADKNDAFRKKIFANVSVGRGDRILEEESASKPMIRRDVEAITKTFLETLRAAWQNGTLRVLGRDEEYV